MDQNLEKTILRNLLRNDAYTRKVLPFVKDEYFSAEEDRILYNEIKDFIVKYNVPPTLDALEIEIGNISNAKEEHLTNIKETIETFRIATDETNVDWLVDSTEKFCQDRALYHAVLKSIAIVNEGGANSISKGAIPSILSDALAISFDPNVGHDYFEQYEQRYEYYHEVQEKIPFDLDFFNRITANGLPKKTLNIAMAGCVHPATKVRIRIRSKTR